MNRVKDLILEQVRWAGPVLEFSFPVLVPENKGPFKLGAVESGWGENGRHQATLGGGQLIATYRYYMTIS